MSNEHSVAGSDTHLAEFGRRATGTSDALRALSHEHRLMILALLNGRERSVGELEQILRLPQPAVSQQLARLRLDSLVSSRRSGRTIFYVTESAKLEAIYRDLGVLLGKIADPAVSHDRIEEEIASGLTVPTTDPAKPGAGGTAVPVESAETAVALNA